MERLSRRDFLKGSFGLGVEGFLLAAGLKYARRGKENQVFKIIFDGDEESLSFSEATQLAKRFDRVYDTLPEMKYPTSKEDVVGWAIEMLPQFEYNGITPKTVWPDRDGIAFVLFPDGDSFNHVAGRSNCENYAVMSIRYENPVSSWYQDEDWPFTLAHELAHVQQGVLCGTAPTDLVENSAQIAAIEICASLVNGGNKLLMRPLVGELRGMALSSAYAIALKESKMPEYLGLRSELSPGAFLEARFERSRRRFSTDPFKLQEILSRYNLTPMGMITKSINTNGANIEGLAFPPVYPEMYGGYSIVSRQPKPIKLDDTEYFIQNLEALAAEV